MKLLYGKSREEAIDFLRCPANTTFAEEKTSAPISVGTKRKDIPPGCLFFLEQDTGVDRIKERLSRALAGGAYPRRNELVRLPLPYQKERPPSGWSFFLEQDTGVEPAFTAWEAVVLPIYESYVCVGIITKGFGKFNHILSVHPLQFSARHDSLKKKQEVFP